MTDWSKKKLEERSMPLPLPDPTIVRKERKCLKCRNLFNSANAGNRICSRCSKNNSRICFVTVPLGSMGSGIRRKKRVGGGSG
jgi:hypothetical protein